jgi:hypothetical protein
VNYGALQTAVLNRINMGTADPVAGNIGVYVNEGLQMVDAAHPNGWPWNRATVQFSTTASVATYSFDTITTSVTIARVHSAKVVADTAWRALEVLSPEEADKFFVSTSETGVPEAIWVEGATVEFIPSPAAVYTASLRVSLAEEELSGDTDTPRMPERFHGAIVAAATVCFYETLQDAGRAQAAAQRVDGWVARMRTAGRESGVLPRVHLRGDV